MDLYEYQARDLFERHGVAVLPGAVAETPEEARQAAEELVGPDGRVVVKAQVKTGGRGKAGGVKLAQGSAEAEARAADILGMDIKGHTVHRVMLSPTASIDQEFYFSVLLDRANRSFLAMASVEGGMEIEEVAVKNPEALVKVLVDPLSGLDAATARGIVEQANFPEDVRGPVAELITQVWSVFVAEDATLVEINPLAQVTTEDGRTRVLALDGKVTLDENAAFRHPEHAAYVDSASADPLEARARERHLNYVKLDGSVGIIGNGAGLVMSTLDVVAGAGEELARSGDGTTERSEGGTERDQRNGVLPANFLDIGGGASARVMADGLDIVLNDPDVKSVFVNVFGGITACDQVATGIVQALDLLASQGEEVTKPLVVRLDGNNAEVGRAILTERAHPLVEQVDTMDGAARRAAELAGR